jgi:hypothetical protein
MKQEACDGIFSVQSQEMKDIRDCLREAHQIRRDERSRGDDHVLWRYCPYLPPQFVRSMNLRNSNCLEGNIIILVGLNSFTDFYTTRWSILTSAVGDFSMAGRDLSIQLRAEWI